ncbi:MAG: helix-turn-helix domain-containing protein [Isosphaeraceae bacterium]
MSHAPGPRPTLADSVPIRLKSSSPPRPPEEPPPAARQAGPPARPGRTLPAGIEPMLGIDDLAALLSCSRRLVERMRSAGKVPRPDIKIGKMPRWKAATIRAWIERGGKP